MKGDSESIGAREVQAGGASRCTKNNCDAVLYSDFHEELHLVNKHDHFPDVGDIGEGFES